ncbi:MAG: ABC transporter permease [Eggerthellaceae bacterium]|nr:ABC transporter permease [Eggerthellaceae bacterium]
MAKRVVKSLAGALVVLLLVTFIAFGLSYLSPTDAAVHAFNEMGIAPTEAQLAAKRAELGLDQPLLVQYGTWVAGLLQGNWGESYRTGAPVASLLFAALPYTLALAATSMALTLVVAVPTGLLCARYRGSAFDRLMQAVTYFFNAMPSFFIALLLLYGLAVRLRWFNVMATRDFAGILMPTLALALPLSAWFSRQVRAGALEQLAQPYVDGLRARGIGEGRILWVHVLRNLGVPLLTLIGVSFGMLLGGSAIVESIFNWPGLGFASVEAVGARDYPFLAAYAMVMAVLYLLVNALVDASYRLVDPRVRGGKGARHA